jgi:hypothetical protein
MPFSDQARQGRIAIALASIGFYKLVKASLLFGIGIWLGGNSPYVPQPPPLKTLASH